MKRAPILAVLAFLAVGLLVPITGFDPSGGSATREPGQLAASPGAVASPTMIAPSPTPPSATPSASPTPVPEIRVAVVPVIDYRSTRNGTGAVEVREILAARSETVEALTMVEADADPILAALGVGRPSDPARLVLHPDVASLAADLAATRNRIGFLRADQVGPEVRALGWEGEALFGVDRVADLVAWSLTATVPAPAGPAAPAPTYDPATAWTLFAGGDMLLDRGVYDTIVNRGMGVDFPFDGGTAEITSRYCCSAFGWQLPRTNRTGNAGAMRALIEGADLAIANFENPAPNSFRWHTTGTVFNADPALIEGLANVGIDWLSLANNHIRDAGAAGIRQTIDNLDRWGIAHGGAGENTAAAHRPSILDANGTKVAILGYDAIASYYWAGPDKVGSASLSAETCQADIAAARAAGAEVVVVFPHWGAEYRATPSTGQQRVGRACLDAGADMVIGNHAHWAAAMEIYDGKPIWYALGNFVFDQTWSEPTMEGITLELTFQGPRLVQARMRPHIVLDRAQPNFLDPAADGRVVMDQIWGASRGLLPW